MGVQGLWQLIEPAGKPVPLESLEHKVLGVDYSIWMYQAITGFRDTQGNAQQNAHLIFLFQRLCKLLYYRIRPVFVFDGGVPELKKQVLANRRQRKENSALVSDQARQRILKNYLRTQAIGVALNEKTLDQLLPTLGGMRNSAAAGDLQLFHLPSGSGDSDDPMGAGAGDASDTDSSEDQVLHKKGQDLDKIDVSSSEFTTLPLDVQYDILYEIRERRKYRRSWAQLGKLPQESTDFSSFQMAGLLRRRQLQQKLDDVEKVLSTQETTYNLPSEEYYLGLGDGELSLETTNSRILSEDATRYLLSKVKRKKLESVTDDAKVEQPAPKRHAIDQLDNLTLDSSSDPTHPSTNFCDLTVGSTHPAEAFTHTASSSSNYKEKGEPEATVVDLVDAESSEKWGSESVNSEDDEIDIQRAVALSLQDARNRNIVAKYDTVVPEVLCNEIISTNSKTKDLECTPVIPHTCSKLIKESCLNVFSSTETLNPEGSSPKQLSPVEDSDESHSSDNDIFDALQKLHSESPPKTVPADDNDPVKGPARFNTFFKEVTATSSQKQKLSVSGSPSETRRQKLTVPRASNSVELCVSEKVVQPSSAVAETEELLPNRATCSNAESPSRSASSTHHLNEEIKALSSMDYDELKGVQEMLQQESTKMAKVSAQQERLAASVTDQMYLESQELLKLFGIPFIMSPMEAEAQCAKLEQLKLTEGTITDDSDIWLFGGEKVFRNVFSKNKIVECYCLDTVKHILNIDRNKMIAIAMLTGCDYTDGVRGVGVVSAVELLSEFPDSDAFKSLQKFSDWWDKKQRGLIPIGSETPVKKKLRSVELTENFPNRNVIEAFLNPVVDDSEERFTWAIPDLASLREFAQNKFGWSQGKTDELLLPVLKRLNERQVQTRIERYFTKVPTLVKEVKNPSKRLQRALNKFNTSGDDPPKSTQPVTVNSRNNPPHRGAAVKAGPSNRSRRSVVNRKRAQKAIREPCLSESSSSE